jgi:hypothetical protein
VNTPPPPAFRFDATSLPILIVEVARASTDAEHREYLATLLRYYNESQLLAVVIDIQTNDLPTFAQQRAQGEWLKEHKALLSARGVGTAFIFRNAAIRFALSAILLIQRLPNKYTAVGTREEAIAWARARLSDRKLRRTQPPAR